MQMIHADGELADEEFEAVKNYLAENEEDVENIIEFMHTTGNESYDKLTTEEICEDIKIFFNKEAHLEVLQTLHKIMHADGKEHPAEVALYNKVKTLLEL